MYTGNYRDAPVLVKNSTVVSGSLDRRDLMGRLQTSDTVQTCADQMERPVLITLMPLNLVVALPCETALT